ncbi:MAG: hypothetical protein MZV70_28840 [Desulfobacterales bacterium]|nr:hypothetical protein [Desulfobacterales bacterium]
MSAADFEAAAVAAAMSMEKNAIEIYSRRAAEAQDPDEKALYDWLAKWETAHLDFLAETRQGTHRRDLARQPVLAFLSGTQKRSAGFAHGCRCKTR